MMKLAEYLIPGACVSLIVCGPMAVYYLMDIRNYLRDIRDDQRKEHKRLSKLEK